MYDTPVNTKHLYNICTMLDQRRRQWANVVRMLYKCFVFAGYLLMTPNNYLAPSVVLSHSFSSSGIFIYFIFLHNLSCNVFNYLGFLDIK